MARQKNEKLRLLYVLKIIWEETDENHTLTAEKIVSRLADYGFEAERKSIYRDLEALEDFGFDIIRGRGGASLVSRDFEAAELKLLSDAIQASRFITQAKSDEIIRKLSSLNSRYEADGLRRSIKTDEKTATDNKTVLYTIDLLHSAMGMGRKISFKYFDWTPQKKKVLRHGGAEYVVSPWSLWWDDEKYYLIAFDSKSGEIRNYRVDKMLSAKTVDEPREGKKAYQKLNLDGYSKKMFGMYGGEECTVTLSCEDSLAGVIIDRFGNDVTIYPSPDGTFTACPRVQISNNFLSWILQFGGRIKICAPYDVVEKMKALVMGAAEDYK